jgi:hypothetical protein
LTGLQTVASFLAAPAVLTRSNASGSSFRTESGIRVVHDEYVSCRLKDQCLDLTLNTTSTSTGGSTECEEPSIGHLIVVNVGSYEGAWGWCGN